MVHLVQKLRVEPIRKVVQIMARQALVFEAVREGYGIDQLDERRTMTVGDLIAILQDYDEDTLFVLSHDNGYTYGSIDRWDASLYEEREDGEWEQCE